MQDRVMRGSGFLAIWSDLAPEDETDWAHWMTREHSVERVRIRGFLACRIFRALGATKNRYFILYDLEKPDTSAVPSTWLGWMHRHRGHSASCRVCGTSRVAAAE
jgi:hypothetical protein